MEVAEGLGLFVVVLWLLGWAIFYILLAPLFILVRVSDGSIDAWDRSAAADTKFRFQCYALAGSTIQGAGIAIAILHFLIGMPYGVIVLSALLVAYSGIVLTFYREDRKIERVLVARRSHV